MRNLISNTSDESVTYKIPYFDLVEVIVDKETHADFVYVLRFLSKITIVGASFVIVYSISDPSQAIETLKKTIKKADPTTISNGVSEGSLVIQKVGNTNIRKFVNLPNKSNVAKTLKSFSNEEIFGLISILVHKLTPQTTPAVILLNKPASPTILRPNAVWTKEISVPTIKNVTTKSYTFFEKVIFISSLINLGGLTMSVAKNLGIFLKKRFERTNSKILNVQKDQFKRNKDEICFQELVLIAQNLKEQINNLPEIPITQRCEEFFTKNYTKEDFMQTVLNIQGGAVNVPIIPDGLNPTFYIRRTLLNELYKILIIGNQNLEKTNDSTNPNKIEERKNIVQHTLDLVRYLPTTLFFPLAFGFLVILPDSKILEEIKQYILGVFYDSNFEKEDKDEKNKKNTFLEWWSIRFHNISNMTKPEFYLMVAVISFVAYILFSQRVFQKTIDPEILPVYELYEDTIEILEEHLEKFKKQKREANFSKIEYLFTYKSLMSRFKKLVRKKFENN